MFDASDVPAEKAPPAPRTPDPSASFSHLRLNPQANFVPLRS